MNGRLFLLSVATLALAGCNPIDVLFPKDERLGEEAENICIGRVRATLTYEAYQELENAPGRFVPSYIYDITRLDLEAVQVALTRPRARASSSRPPTLQRRSNASSRPRWTRKARCSLARTRRSSRYAEKPSRPRPSLPADARASSPICA